MKNGNGFTMDNDGRMIPAAENDTRLRILYLYQLLLNQSDEEHPLSTQQIMELMEKQHGISMHRTTVPSDIALLQAAGFEIMAVRKHAWHYYLSDRSFSIPELKILIDAVQSSKLITEKKSEALIHKLTLLTSESNAAKLKRTVSISERVKSDNEKGYYIVDTLNAAINAGVKISFCYYNYNNKKHKVLKNDGAPYTVSPYNLIWDGDFYYLVGYCDEREGIRVFRVDRICESPELLTEEAAEQPEGYSVSKYTKEAFRMFVSHEPIEVTLLCKTEAMNAVIDRFGTKIRTKAIGTDEFQARVKVCPGPTFYRWVFGFGSAIRIVGPEDVFANYIDMLKQELELHGN